MRAHDMLSLILLTTTVVGCSMGEPRAHGPHTFTYDCSGLGKGFGDCDEKAAAQCGKQGYDVVSRTGDSVNNEMKRTMVVSCR